MNDRKGDIHLAKRIKNLRRMLGLTQEELAEKAEISISMLQKIEGGSLLGSRTTHQKLAKVLKTSYIYLLNGIGIGYEDLTGNDEKEEFSVWLQSTPMTPEEVNMIRRLAETYLESNRRPDERKKE